MSYMIIWTILTIGIYIHKFSWVAPTCRLDTFCNFSKLHNISISNYSDYLFSVYVSCLESWTWHTFSLQCIWNACSGTFNTCPFHFTSFNHIFHCMLTFSWDTNSILSSMLIFRTCKAS